MALRNTDAARRGTIGECLELKRGQGPMPLAVQIARQGGPEEMKLVELPVGAPGPGEVRIRHHAIGLNFIDVYQRSGLYPLPVPLTLGMEGAGVIEAVGEGVTHLRAGDRAA